ncbi:MAG: sugar phosphate isomerase/epimerase [Vicinamibacterales bacterium]
MPPSRREILLSPAALLAAEVLAAGAAPTMTLALHQNTSARAGYRGSLEGWARAGITQVELAWNVLDAFVKTESVAAAKRVLADNGLTPVSASCGAGGLIEPNPDRAAALDALKAQCETLATLGLTRTYTTTASAVTPTPEGYASAPERLHELGEIGRQHGLVVMVEFVRQSVFASTLTTLLPLVRAAAHPNVAIVFDCYHFWSGLNKLADLDLLRPGDIGHAHFQDVPAIQRELLSLTTREIPGDGVSPLTAILQALAKAGYAGPLSVELFAARFQQGDPTVIAREIATKAEAVMRRATVM